MAFEEQQPFDPASFEHIPVLLNECLTGLAIDPAGTYLDGTAGGAGHSRQIALRLDAAKGGRLISLDQDPDAVQTARSRLAGLPATVVQINFRYAGQALEQLGIEKINGALLDLGVSSHQLDDAARGFSYRADAPLDMRMSQQGETAADLVNTESREELARILRDYGEEPYAWQIAGKIVEARETAPILTTLQLADIVASAMPPAERRKNKNPLPPHLSGTAHCSEPRVGCAGRGLGYHFRSPCTGRPVVRDHLPLSGGPAGQEQVPPLVHSLYLPAGVSGVCMRRQGKGKAYHPQTH